MGIETRRCRRDLPSPSLVEAINPGTIHRWTFFIDKLHTSTFTSYPEPFKVKDFFCLSRMSSSSSLIALAMEVCSFLTALLEASTFFTAWKHSLCSRTYKPCDWVVASGARLIDGVAGRLPPFFNKIYKKCSKCIVLTTFLYMHVIMYNIQTLWLKCDSCGLAHRRSRSVASFVFVKDFTL